MTSAQPYFPTLLVSGVRVDFAHLEPFKFSVPTAARPNGARIEVRFSNHCFSESYDTAKHVSSVDVWDGHRRRVFDEARYALSLGLRGIIEALPMSSVFQTPEANFVWILAPESNGLAEYRIYFNVKRDSGPGAADLRLFVESAYAPDPTTALKASRMTRVRFALLIDKVVRGEKLRFQYKR